MIARTYYGLCLTLGWLLRSVRYSQVRIVSLDGALHVQKRRVAVAPVLIWLGNLLMRVLGTGVWILSQREWEERERQIYRTLRDTSIRVDAGRVVVLPWLAGKTLASLLEDPALQESMKRTAIERAVVALAGFHHAGLTHGDAMAENVLVDNAGGACWFDFETIHDPRRPVAWQRADDVRALLVTCLIRVEPGKVAETFRVIVDAYADEAVTRVLTPSFSSVFRRALSFHLAQAGLSFQRFKEIGRLLTERESKRSGER